MLVSNQFYHDKNVSSKIKNTREALNYTAEFFVNTSRETMCLLVLDSNFEVITVSLYHGNGESVAISTKDIMIETLCAQGVAIILVHNHPSGDLRPSLSDKRFTQSLYLLCEGLSVQLIDHLIINSEGHRFSFREHNLL